MFPVSTPRLLRWLKPLTPMHEILRSRRIERGSTISAPKSITILFTPQFMQSNTHPQVTLKNSLLPLEKTPCILKVTYNPDFKFYAHVKSIVTGLHPESTSSRPLLVPTRVSKRKPYLTPICPLSYPFSCMQLPFDSPTSLIRFHNILSFWWVKELRAIIIT